MAFPIKEPHLDQRLDQQPVGKGRRRCPDRVGKHVLFTRSIDGSPVYIRVDSIVATAPAQPDDPDGPSVIWLTSGDMIGVTVNYLAVAELAT